MAARHIVRDISPFSDPLDGEFGRHVYRDVIAYPHRSVTIRAQPICQHRSTSELVTCRRLWRACSTRRSRPPRGALGDGLLSIVLFEARLRSRLRPTSDVNLLILVDRFDPTRVDTLRPTLQQRRAAVRLAVMWLTQDELQAAGESFSVKFADIVRRHRVLYGNDPFERFTVSRRAAIARVQRRCSSTLCFA